MRQAELGELGFDDIIVNAFGLRNPRHQLEDIDQLVDSIRHNGLQVPLTVWEADDPETGELRYVLVAGYRRHAAIKILREEDPTAFETLRVVVQTGSLNDAMAKNLEENIQNSPLNPADECLGVARLYERVGDQTEVGKKLGKSQSWVSGRVKLHRNLATRVFGAFRTGQINLTQAHYFATILNTDGTPNCDLQNELLDKLLNDERIQEPKQKTHRTKAEVAELAEMLVELLNTLEAEHHRERAYTIETCVEWLQCKCEVRDLLALIQPSDEEPTITGVV